MSQSLNENEREKILDRINIIKEDIYETKAYISSDFCQRCSDMYVKLNDLENELEQLKNKL